MGGSSRTYDELPDQRSFCTQPGSVCGHVLKQSRRILGRTSSEKRLAVLTNDGVLLLYKYYLLAVGAGSPLIGRLIKLHEAKSVTVTLKKDTVKAEIQPHIGRKLAFCVAGEEAKVWAAKLFVFSVKNNNTSDDHPTHEVFCCEKEKDRPNALSFVNGAKPRKVNSKKSKNSKSSTEKRVPTPRRNKMSKSSNSRRSSQRSSRSRSSKVSDESSGKTNSEANDKIRLKSLHTSSQSSLRTDCPSVHTDFPNSTTTPNIAAVAEGGPDDSMDATQYTDTPERCELQTMKKELNVCKP